MDSSPLLTEATTKQLFVELARRYDFVLLGVVQKAGNPQEQFQMFHSGGVFPAIGLAQAMRTELVKTVLDATEIKNPEGT